MQDEYDYHHYSIENIGIKPIQSVYKTDDEYIDTTKKDKSTLEKTREIMTLLEHYNFMNSKNCSVKQKVLYKR